MNVPRPVSPSGPPTARTRPSAHDRAVRQLMRGPLRSDWVSARLRLLLIHIPYVGVDHPPGRLVPPYHDIFAVDMGGGAVGARRIDPEGSNLACDPAVALEADRLQREVLEPGLHHALIHFLDLSPTGRHRRT